MITRINTSWQPTNKQTSTLPPENWQKQMAEAVRSPAELFDILNIPVKSRPEILVEPRHFPLLVTQSYIRRIAKRDPNDPLLRQILPLAIEASTSNINEKLDPVGDLDASTAPGLLQKYHGRALLISTGACAIHCRYCFRRHFPYNEQSLTATKWQETFKHLKTQTDIHEIILSGGDPLMLSNQRLATIIEKINDIPHIKRLRIHTRLPVVLPSRINDGLIELIDNIRMPVVIVIHANHPNELDNECVTAIQRLNRHHTTLLNQSVLLQGINDHSQTLITLSEKLFDAGVLPYYLHMLDKVTGAEHFNVEDHCATQIIETLRNTLPGYLVPKLVREESGQPSKTPL